MIFDEATSALDVETERQLQLAMTKATKGRTTFIIAHRLATVRNADRIFVFDHGRIVEQGSYEDLIDRGGRFAKLAETKTCCRHRNRISRPSPATAPGRKDFN